MIRCIIADDEIVILGTLQRALLKAGAQVGGAYQDAAEALAAVKAVKPDAVFLDVEMPGMNGIELAERIRAIDEDIQIVFVTAHEQYAIKAFELSAAYYVLKPISQEKIDQAVLRVQRVRTMRQNRGIADMPAMIGTPADMPDKLSVKVHEDILILKLQDILFLKSEKGKTVLVTKDGSYTSISGLKSWEERLSPAGFIRCHRGYIVNASYIKRMVHIMGAYRELVLDFCEVNIPVSRQRVDAVKRWMGIQ